MNIKHVRTTIAIAEPQAHQLDMLSVERGVTRSAIIRDAIHDYLKRSDQQNANLGRMAMTSEFTQIAVDILIREQAPERRDEILATVEERMERYHAQG